MTLLTVVFLKDSTANVSKATVFVGVTAVRIKCLLSITNNWSKASEKLRHNKLDAFRCGGRVEKFVEADPFGVLDESDDGYAENRVCMEEVTRNVNHVDRSFRSEKDQRNSLVSVQRKSREKDVSSMSLCQTQLCFESERDVTELYLTGVCHVQDVRLLLRPRSGSLIMALQISNRSLENGLLSQLWLVLLVYWCLLRWIGRSIVVSWQCGAAGTKIRGDKVSSQWLSKVYVERLFIENHLTDLGPN